MNGKFEPWIVVALTLCLVHVGCKQEKKYAHDFTTPQGAVLCFEDAIRSKDLEAAIRCRDFSEEASMRLTRLKPNFDFNPQVIANTAKMLEISFTSEIKTNGFPDLSSATSAITKVDPKSETLVLVTQEYTYTDGRKEEQKLYVKQTSPGWRIVHVGE